VVFTRLASAPPTTRCHRQQVAKTNRSSGHASHTSSLAGTEGLHHRELHYTSPCICTTHAHLAAPGRRRHRGGEAALIDDRPAAEYEYTHASKRAAPRRPSSRVGHESVSASVQAADLAGDRHYNCRFASSWTNVAQHACAVRRPMMQTAVAGSGGGVHGPAHV
jgi:hypothetical protein